MMTPESKYLLNTIKLILHDEPMPDQTPVGLKSIDYNKVFHMAKQNSIANMAAYCICDDKTVPEDVRRRFDLERLKIISQQIKQGQVLSDIKEILKESDKEGIILKGSIIKSLYPEAFMRSMGDIDVFMEENNIKQICNAFIDRGYSTGVIGIGNHYEFKNYDVAKIEFHPELVALESEYGRKVFKQTHPDAKSVADKMDLWEHTEPFDGSENVRQLTTEYHYVYIIMHMMNHFLISGTGIRSFIDVWVMNHHFGGVWDRKALNELLDRFGLLKFEQYAVALADRWFDLDTEGWQAMDVDGDALDALEKYILESGTYGIIDNKILNNMNHDTSYESKIHYLLGTVFKPLNWMKNFYPILNKAPILLPTMWVRRAFDLTVKHSSRSKAKLRAVAAADQIHADKVKELMERVI